MNRRARDADVPVRWVPIAELSELARALLGERRDDRDVIPEHVADRVGALAKQWAAHGFTAQTVEPWVDLKPAAAALLASRGISPETLRRHTVAGEAGETSLWQAVLSGVVSAAEAADRIDGSAAPEPAAEATPPPVSGTRPAPALFSHPTAELEPDTSDRRRRSMPPQTPFST
jgi:hypothetical protein